MTDRLEVRKIFLIAAADQALRNRIEAFVNSHIQNATIWQAQDGSEAFSKMENVPPHVLITTHDLPKLDEIRLVAAILNDKRFESTSAILMRPPPDEGLFVDEIVTGRVQFLADEVDGRRLAKALARALNDVASRENTEFHMRFLAPAEVLIRQGAKAEHVFLVRRGRLEATQGQGEQKLVLGHVETGEFVGEMAYINGEPRSADVTALVDCELIEIPIDHLDALLFRKPSWAKALMSTLSRRVKRLNLAKTADPA